MTMTKTIREVLILTSKPKEIARVEIFLEGLKNKLQLDESRYNKLLVAITEAVNNGIIHGNNRDPKKKIILTCEFSKNTLTVRVEDEGEGVDPSTLPNPLSSENLLRENGRGVFLMRSLMDKVEFERATGRSAVVLKMRIR